MAEFPILTTKTLQFWLCRRSITSFGGFSASITCWKSVATTAYGIYDVFRTKATSVMDDAPTAKTENVSLNLNTS